MSATIVSEVSKINSYSIFENHEQYELRLGQTLSGEIVRPFVIKFQAKWCNPCHRIHDEWVELTRKWCDYVDFYICDVDENEKTAQWCSAQSLPYFFGINSEGKIWFTTTELRQKMPHTHEKCVVLNPTTNKLDHIKTLNNILTDYLSKMA